MVIEILTIHTALFAFLRIEFRFLSSWFKLSKFHFQSNQQLNEYSAFKAI